VFQFVYLLRFRNERGWFRVEGAEVMAVLLEEFIGDCKFEKCFTNGEKVAHDEPVTGESERPADGNGRVVRLDDDSGTNEVALGEQRDRCVESVE